MTNATPNPEQRVQVLRTRTFKLGSQRQVSEQVAGFIRVLALEGFTGKLQVNMNQGSVACVSAEEKLPNNF